MSETRNRSFFTCRRPQVAPGRSLSACSHHTGITHHRLKKQHPGYNLDSPSRGDATQDSRLRSPLHSIMLVVIFFPVPPSTRQAAGPLTENLPHVCLSDRKTVD